MSDTVSEYTSSTPNELKSLLSTKEMKAKVKDFIKSSQIKQKKEKKDSNEPKKPANAYNLFCKDKRDSVTKANPGVQNHEIMGLLAKEWEKFSKNFPDEYQKYVDTVNEQKLEYEEKMREYRMLNNIPEKIKRVPKPKGPVVEKPQTPFHYFFKDKMDEMIVSHPNSKKKDLYEEIKEMWKKLKEDKDEIVKKYKQIAKNKRDTLTTAPAPIVAPSTPVRTPISSPIAKIDPSTPVRTPKSSPVAPDTEEFPQPEVKKEKKKKKREDGEKKIKKKKKLIKVVEGSDIEDNE
jgi:hypothetical protein